MIEISSGLRGEYKLLVRKLRKVHPRGKHRGAKTSARWARRAVTGWVPNMILDQGLDHIGNGVSSPAGWCSVGTNNTPANASQTALLSHHQSTSNRTAIFAGNTGNPTYIIQVTGVYLFPTQASNQNYTEVGIGPITGGANLFSRALIVDVGGTPTSFTVLAGEQLEVTYRLWFYQQLTDIVTVVNISGVNYTFTHRASNAGGNTTHAQNILQSGTRWLAGSLSFAVYNGAVGAITTTPGGSITSGTSHSIAGYTNGTFYRDVTYSASTTQLNLGGGITSIATQMDTGGSTGWPVTQTGVSPAIPKDNTKTFSITMRHSWARVP